MDSLRECLIAINPEWDPEELASRIHNETELWWNKGWVFERAESDALMESICLWFRWPEEQGLPPPKPLG